MEHEGWSGWEVCPQKMWSWPFEQKLFQPMIADWFFPWSLTLGIDRSDYDDHDWKPQSAWHEANSFVTQREKADYVQWPSTPYIMTSKRFFKPPKQISIIVADLKFCPQRDITRLRMLRSFRKAVVSWWGRTTHPDPRDAPPRPRVDIHVVGTLLRYRYSENGSKPTININQCSTHTLHVWCLIPIHQSPSLDHHLYPTGAKSLRSCAKLKRLYSKVCRAMPQKCSKRSRTMTTALSRWKLSCGSGGTGTGGTPPWEVWLNS